MANALQAVRGMNDVLPEDAVRWRAVEQVIARVLTDHGYGEIRLPIIERTELYRRSIGDVTDIVEKEMYTFEDRNGDSLSLRPEGTAGCVRAGIEHGLLHHQIQRLWYAGPMFRHERPQKGRYRQFQQVGVEAYGMEGPDIDGEMLLLTRRLWKALGLTGLRLEVNSLGTPEDRARYRDGLLDYLRPRAQDLDDDSRRRLESNPLRILDSKNPSLAQILADAPKLSDYLGADARRHFDGVLALLDDEGVAFVVNSRLVRGLDYYSHTVFEWVADGLAAQSTVCAGGRYDGLVEQLGGGTVPAVGFALGFERLMAVMEQQSEVPSSAVAPDAYLMVEEPGREREAQRTAERLRDAGLRVVLNCGGGQAKTQMKRALRYAARHVVIFAEGADLVVRELAQDGQGRAQTKVDAAGLVGFLSAAKRDGTQRGE